MNVTKNILILLYDFSYLRTTNLPEILFQLSISGILIGSKFYLVFFNNLENHFFFFKYSYILYYIMVYVKSTRRKNVFEYVVFEKYIK